MYFYKVSASGYEEHMETTYYSEHRYTQEEFEDIVFKVYEEICRELISDETSSLCYPNIYFSVEEIIWDYKGKFREKMKTYNLYSLSKKLTGSMFFDLTCDSFFTKVYQNVTDVYNKRINEIIHDLNIDLSCWDNNCPYLENYDDEEKKYTKEDCLVHTLKGELVQNKNCSNCDPPYYDKSICEGKNYCEHWHWNGESE